MFRSLQPLFINSTGHNGTEVPEQACSHQREAKNTIGKMGFTEMGTPCCDRVVEATGVVLSNTKDKVIVSPKLIADICSDFFINKNNTIR